MKRLIVCSDGTWQKLSSPYPTNVVKLAQAIKPSSEEIPQIVFYDEGIGTEDGTGNPFASVGRILEGAFGTGIDTNIQEAYRFLCLNYEPGDEIYLFGFSRGAYTVRSLAGLINCSGGLLKLPNIREAPFAYELYRDRTLTPKEKAAFRKLPIPYEYLTNATTIKSCRSEAHKIYQERQRGMSVKDAEDAEEKGSTQAQRDFDQKRDRVQQLLKKYGLSERNNFHIQDAKITLLGCWDTVGALGIPNVIPFLSQWVNRKYEFHDTRLSSRIQNALHATAIDETRHAFDVTPMARKPGDKQLTYQVWFPGTHGCVGGGTYSERGLSDRGLVWMMDQIKELGLGLEFDRLNAESGIQPDHTVPFNRSPGIFSLLGSGYRNLGNDPKLDDSVKQRWHDCLDYRPPNLREAAERYDWK